jgi:hypothetical protein
MYRPVVWQQPVEIGAMLCAVEPRNCTQVAKEGTDGSLKSGGGSHAVTKPAKTQQTAHMDGDANVII